MPSVVQSWVGEIPLMQQSVLLAAVRGPDGITKYSAAKQLLRWYRRCILVSAFDGVVLTTPLDQRGGSFTGPSLPTEVGDGNSWEMQMAGWIEAYFIEFDSYPSHFTKHFMMAVEILGYKHPDQRIRNWWHELYFRLVGDLHLNPESVAQLDYRLGDNRDQWLSVAEPATTS